MTVDAAAIDREVVRKILREWLSPRTAAQLVSLGYERQMVREVFNEEFAKWLASSKL